MKRLIVLLLIVTSTPAIAATPECTTKVCVKVYTDPKTHQLVITAKRNGSFPKPVVTHRSTPRPTPRPIPTPTVRRTYKPRAAVVIKTKRPSLADELTKLIPSGQLHTQPAPNGLVGMPMYFMTDIPWEFLAAVKILGVAVKVRLQPYFVFSFGDGSEISTLSPGGPYPYGTVLHTYTKSGDYEANVSVQWSGTYVADGVESSVGGNPITQILSSTVHIYPGPTKFTK